MDQWHDRKRCRRDRTRTRPKQYRIRHRKTEPFIVRNCVGAQTSHTQALGYGRLKKTIPFSLWAKNVVWSPCRASLPGTLRRQQKDLGCSMARIGVVQRGSKFRKQVLCVPLLLQDS